MNKKNILCIPTSFSKYMFKQMPCAVVNLKR